MADAQTKVRAVACEALRLGPGSFKNALEAMLKVLEDSDPAIKADGDRWRAEQAGKL